jgi:phycocyanobilin lyase beta subunit
MTEIQALKLICAVEEADSSTRLLEAVRQLAAARLEAAIPTLIDTLGYNNPGAAVAAVEGLIQLGESAVQPLLDTLDGYNYGARAWAVRALAGIGDPRGLETLLVAAKTDFAMSVRRAAARGLGNLHWHQLPPEQIQPAQAQALEALVLVSQDPEWIVRYAAIVGLQGLGLALVDRTEAMLVQILQHFEQCAATDDHLTVRARIRLAQQQLHQGDASSQTHAHDWQSTLQRIYDRKAQERPLPEGDPRRFRPVALALATPPPEEGTGM